MSAREMQDTETPAAVEAPVIAYKGFGPDWRCRDFQYAIGQTYTLAAGEPARCTARGFHACEHPLDVWNYYSPRNGSRFAEVAMAGAIDRAADSDTKIAAAQITIRAEVVLPEWIKRAASWVVARAVGNVATGYSGHAAATGYRGHAAATGYSGHAAATGDRGIAIACGVCATAKAGASGAIMLAAWRYDNDLRRHVIATVRAAMVGGPEGVKPGVVYRLSEVGEFEEVSP